MFNVSAYYLLVQDESPTIKIVLQVFFFLWYLSYMMVVIEPGQRIHDKASNPLTCKSSYTRRL